MPLRGPRFSGDPILEQCFDGAHRMFAPERGIAVMRVQSALVELGVPVGPHGTDGIFGDDTGTAVSFYKTRKGLVPTDPVVGAGTSRALDDDLFFDPPALDPAFAEFAPTVVAHRVEPFIGRQLASLISAPLDSWRRMVAVSALNALNSRVLLGAVALSRAPRDMQGPYLASAAPTQEGNLDAGTHFSQQVPTLEQHRAAGVSAASGRTVSFVSTDGTVRSFVWVDDEVIMGRGFVTRTSTAKRARVTLLGVLMHELNHVRNLRRDDVVLAQTLDTDASVYVDTALAQASSAAGTPTVEVFRSFVREICARHLHWISQKEEAGDPFAARFLAPEKLVEAARFYVVDTSLFHQGGYLPGVIAQGDAAVFGQIAHWLRVCQTLEFSDDPAENARTKALFEDAATVSDNFGINPPLDFPEADGLFPLPADFTL